MSRLVYLKVKIKSLAAEARIIRKEEGVWKTRRPADPATQTDYFIGLKRHRTWDVRNEARCAQLAYALLRGRPYLMIEAKCYELPSYSRVAELIDKYGDGASFPAGVAGQSRAVRLGRLTVFVAEWTKTPAISLDKAA